MVLGFLSAGFDLVSPALLIEKLQIYSFNEEILTCTKQFGLTMCSVIFCIYFLTCKGQHALSTTAGNEEVTSYKLTTGS